MGAGLKSSARRAAVFSVALVLLLCFQGVVMAETETETRTQTATLSFGIQQYQSFSMVPPSGSSLAGYHYGSGSARVQPQGTFLSVHFNAEGVAVWDLLEGVSNGGGQQVVTLLQSATTQQSTSPVGTQRTTQAVPAGYVFVTGLAGLSGKSSAYNHPTGGPSLLLSPNGQWKAFDATCTHAPCTVQYQASQIYCPCHGGVFDPSNGSVITGPPPTRLPEYRVLV
jgi:Rieske Fe-S protein